jgi:hypothetical protein
MKIFKTLQMLLMSLVFISSVMPSHLHGEMDESHHHSEEEIEQVDHGHCPSGHDLPDSDELGFLFPFSSGTISCCQHPPSDAQIAIRSLSKPSTHPLSKLFQESVFIWGCISSPKHFSALIYSNAYLLLDTTVCPDRTAVLRI